MQDARRGTQGKKELPVLNLQKLTLPDYWRLRNAQSKSVRGKEIENKGVKLII